MKKILMLFMAAFVAFSGFCKSTDKNEKVTTDTVVTYMIVPGMTCENCENKIKSNLRFEKGVKKIEANAPGNQVTVTYDKRKTDEKKVGEGFEKIGYKATPAGCGKAKAHCDKAATTCKKGKAECGKAKAHCDKVSTTCEKGKAECGKAKAHCDKAATTCEKGKVECGKACNKCAKAGKK